MEWRDTGFVLATRRHGESALIVELLTKEHGRHAGLVRGGQSPRRRAVLQPGNSVAASWRGRRGGVKRVAAKNAEPNKALSSPSVRPGVTRRA